jgi:outer membrane receptor protein involved in Fe transport
MTRPILRILLLMVGTSVAFGGTTGKIAGRVTDTKSGEPLIGANVVVQGTSLGASTDAEGNYFVINVPPGNYDVRATLVGYTPTVTRAVRVTVDQTSLTNIRLDPSTVELGEMVVQAERPMVQKDNTATIAVVSSEQIKMLPVKNFVEVLQMQAGVVGEGSRINIRGGRGNEVAYLIDGMYVKDPVLGGLGTKIHNDAIQELNFLSGTFNAEYGNALSGVVNIVTKEGGRKFSGNIEGRTSEFFVTPYKQYHENRVGATISGPVAGDDFNFFASGERDARGSWLPFGYDNTLSLIGKLSARILPEIKTTGTFRYSENQNKPYSHSWKYIPDQALRTREYSRQGTIAVTHTVSPSLFYDARFSYFDQSYYSGVDKDTSQYVSVGDEAYFPNIGTGFEFFSVRDPLELTDNRTKTWNAKGDLVWQVGTHNEIKLGGEFKRHQLDYFDVYDPKRNFPYITRFTQNPYEAAAYVQDKIELNALVVNLGLRFDYVDQRAPFRANPLDPSSVVASKSKTQWSPRLGVAHPISERTSLHFSYGHFFQLPSYSRFYENSQYDLNVREPLFGQPDLDAERTVAYEVGINHQFTPNLAGSFTAYYKDVTGLVGTRYFLPFTTGGRYVGYTLYVNEAYANMKGFEVSLTMRRVRYFAGSLTYTYSVAKGSASSEQENYPGTTESTLLYPLDFDKTHLLNLNVSLSLPENEGPELFGVFPLENTLWNVVLRANSGYPYTPGGRDVGFIQRNSARMPATYTVDMEIEKEWKVSDFTLSVFAEILNLTDHKNVVAIYTDTGEPDATTLGHNSQEYIQDPSNFGPPRRIQLGARLRF